MEKVTFMKVTVIHIRGPDIEEHHCPDTIISINDKLRSPKLPDKERFTRLPSTPNRVKNNWL